MVAEIFDVVIRTVVCKIEVVGLGGIFGSQGVDLLDNGNNVVGFADGADLEVVGSVETEIILADGAGDLEVAEALLFGSAKQT